MAKQTNNVNTTPKITSFTHCPSHKRMPTNPSNMLLNTLATVDGAKVHNYLFPRHVAKFSSGGKKVCHKFRLSSSSQQRPPDKARKGWLRTIKNREDHAKDEMDTCGDRMFRANELRTECGETFQLLQGRGGGQHGSCGWIHHEVSQSLHGDLGGEQC